MKFKASSVVLLVLAMVGCGEVKKNGNNSAMCNADGTCTESEHVL